MIYSELVKNTDTIFDRDLRLPNNLDFENRIINERWALERSVKVYDYRRWQLRQMGFQQFAIQDIIGVMYGSQPSYRYYSEDKTYYEFVLNHHTGRNERKKWLHSAEYFARYKDYGLLHWPPFEHRLLWKCKVVNLNELSSEFPPTAMLRLLRVKALGVFNVFHVVEPVIPRHTTRKPILLGTVWELPPKHHGRSMPGYTEVGYVAHFFLAEWDNGRAIC